MRAQVLAAELPDVATSGDVWDAFEERLRGFVRQKVGNVADVDDILQDTFLKIHRHLPELRSRERLTSWLFQIARNTVTDYYRRQGTAPDYLADEARIPQAESVETELGADVAAWLRPMVDSLPEPYRQAIVLTDYEGITQRELAERLGILVSGAKSRVQRARARVREMLLQCCHIELDRRGRVVDYRPREADVSTAGHEAMSPVGCRQGCGKDDAA